MKKYLNWIIILILVIQVLSCDTYKSKVPITNSDSSSINKDLIGRWVGLSKNELFLYPQVEINLQQFNNKEYVATSKVYENKGRVINSVETYKVHNSSVENGDFLNIKRLNSNNQNYVFYKIEQDFKDSIYIRFLTDSLKLVFESSNNFRKHLLEEKSKFEEIYLSKTIPFYRWESLTWDKINIKNRSNEFSEFFLLGKQDEKYFMKLSSKELKEIIKNKKGIKIEKVREYFGEIQLIGQNTESWKVPNYGLIKMKSGEFIKLKFDLIGNTVKDMTNNINYLNRNKTKWKF